MFQQAFIPSIMAWGLYFILTLGLYDFSLGAIMVLAGILGGTAGLLWGYVVMIVVCIVVSMLLEFVNGIAYIKLKIPSMIVTVGLLMIYEVFGVLFNKGRGVSLPDHMLLFGKAPFNIIVGLATMALGALDKSIFK